MAAMLPALARTSLLDAGSEMTRLVLFQNDLRAAHLAPLLEHLGRRAAGGGSVSLRELDLSNNELGPEGARAIVENVLRRESPYP